MRKVVFQRDAKRRLLELTTYIASEAGAEIALGYIDRIEAFCGALGELPERGRLRDDIMPGLRTITMERRVTVVYRVSASQVSIITVSYGGRDFARELKRPR